MVTSLPFANSTRFMMRELDLDPQVFTGTFEVVDRIVRLYISQYSKALSQEAAAEYLSMCKLNIGSDVERARKYCQPFFTAPDDVTDAVYCASIAGVDLCVLEAQYMPWKTDGAKTARALVEKTASIKDAQTFQTADTTLQFVTMLQLHTNLTEANARFSMDPRPLAGLDKNTVAGVGAAANLHLPEIELTEQIIAAEKAFLALWEKHQRRTNGLKPRLVQ